MATDQAHPSSDIQKSTTGKNQAAQKPVRQAQKASNSSGAARKSVLEKVRPPRRSLGEYMASREGRLALITYVVSTLLHAVVLMALALIILKPDAMDELLSIVSTIPEKEVQDEDIFQALEQPKEIYNDSFDKKPDESIATDIVEETTPLELDINDLDPSTIIDDASFLSIEEISKEGEFGGRSSAGKKGLVKSQGGNAASEAAVVRALKWLAEQQLPDGSWSFDEIGANDNPGVLNNCPSGATGMALMAFLGAGHTHQKEGPYQEHVQRGLTYLMSFGRPVPAGIDFRSATGQGNMYVQGICTIALAEAYGMTKDKRMRAAVEGGLSFIVQAQHSAGGWRYRPLERGDTSVVGWQVMALVSGKGAGIRIPRPVLNGASKFLNGVQAADDKYVYYGYTDPGKGNPSLTAVGLLSRMYLGWKSDNESLKKGVAFLAKVGPSKTNEYYNYYATQVMHHWGGEAWTKWNDIMRDQLIDTQIKKGLGAGSWDPVGPHSEQGGRLYSTVMNVMSLEVYYRHLPLYQRNAVQGDF